MTAYQSVKEQLSSELEELEAQRVKLHGELKKILTISIVIAALGLAIAFIAGAFQIIIVAVIIAGGLYGVFYSMKNSKYKTAFKQQVIPAIVEAVNPNLTYQPNNHITKSQFYASKIFTDRADRFKGEDYFSGTIGKTEVEFSELNAQEKHTTTDSKGRRQTHYVTFFNGLFMIADFHKEFKGETIVLPDTAEKTLGWLGKKLQKWNVAREDLVYLENPDFEKEFVVYGTDQVESRYILSPGLMERILSLKHQFKCPIYLSFIHSKVYLAVYSNKSMLEPKLSESLLEYDAVQKFFNEIGLCVEIIDQLNLNTRIWTKE